MENVALTQESRVAPSTPEKPKKPKKKLGKKARKWLKRGIIVLVLAGVVLFSLRSCAGQQSAVLTGLYLPSVATKQNLVVSVTGTGTIAPIHSYKVTTLIKGEVLEAPFEEGQVVEKDALLFRMDAKDVESSIRQAELSVRSAQLTYDDLLKTRADNSQDRNIKANATGVVTKLYIDAGDSVSVGAPIADILDRDSMKLTLPFHSGQAAGFTVGQAATVAVDGTLATLSGTVDSIAATDEVGPGGTLVRNVTILVVNPGAISDASSGTARIGTAASAQSAKFAYGAQKQLVAKLSGEVESLSVKESDRVTKDQLLGVFKEVSLDTQVKAAQISLENAQLGLQNAKDRLEDYTIRSTINGTVIEKNIEAGDNIDGTATASAVTYPAVIYDLSALTFDVKIDELDINKIKLGQSVEITSAALGGKRFTGHVDKVNINGTTVGSATTYPVTVLVDHPEELLPGMNVSAKILVENAGNVLCIPVDAVSRGNVVLVAGPGALDETGNIVDPSKLTEREITLGRNDSALIEVLSGLEEGETVYTKNVASNAMAAMMGG